MTIQLHRLEGFYWVSRHEGYAQAARNFPYPITQPAVHQQVKKLETELGCKLFERVAKDRVIHTPQGRRLFEFCSPFFEGLPAVVRAIESGDASGELRIDGTGLAVRHLLPGWIRRIRAAHPNIRVVLTEVTDPDLARLRTGDADIIVDTFDDVPETFGCVRVGSAYAFLVVPEDHPAAQKKKNRRELGGETFVAYPAGTRHHELQLRGLETLGLHPGQLITAPTAESILAFVAAGLGFSLIPWLSKPGPEKRGVAAQRLKGEDAEFPLHAVSRVGPGESPAAQAALLLAPKRRKG